MATKHARVSFLAAGPHCVIVLWVVQCKSPNGSPCHGNYCTCTDQLQHRHGWQDISQLSGFTVYVAMGQFWNTAKSIFFLISHKNFRGLYYAFARRCFNSLYISNQNSSYLQIVCMNFKAYQPVISKCSQAFSQSISLES